MSENDPATKSSKKRKSGIPTGNAGEYFVMGELLRRGYDAQLADRNTQGYDILVGTPEERVLHKVQIKSVRSVPWFVKASDFEGDLLNQVTIYVLIGSDKAARPVRYFLAYNRELIDGVHRPAGWTGSAFMPLRTVLKYEDRWDLLRTLSTLAPSPEPNAAALEVPAEP